LLFNPLTKQFEILDYYLNYFLDCNHVVKPLTLLSLLGAFGGFTAMPWVISNLV